MKDSSENKLSMEHAVNTYLGSPAGSLLMANPTVTSRKATLVARLGEIATLTGSKTTLTGEARGATAAKKLTRAELNRLIGKISSGLVSAFRANNDPDNATAVTLTKSAVTRTRDQDLPALAALLTGKATLVSALLTAHNLTSSELGLLTTSANAWGGTASKGTAKRSGSKATLKAAEDKIDDTAAFLKSDLDPLINTFLLSTVEAERIAAAGYFNARIIIDLHGPGAPPAPPPPPGP